jgi:hypothetical protein
MRIEQRVFCNQKDQQSAFLLKNVLILSAGLGRAKLIGSGSGKVVYRKKGYHSPISIDMRSSWDRPPLSSH